MIAFVIESAVQPDPAHGTWVLCGNAGPGWTTADGGQTFSAPTPISVRILTKIDYTNRFTQAERIAIRTAAATNAVVNDYVELLRDSVTVNLDDTNVINALASLTSAGLLAVGRSTVITA